ncbi:anthranilate phosphoribosyltransferase [Chitinispirillales bacterium ANBcel5]|uniref:anthranilate phosphoribosyltransferase n=1 Tax=Cellulosispirillum alkaliphilum TaxID=3039283 RepID=UPI002A52C11D|nr:anthranilate phosphoribosyltransferase [Chitinispirillales bacterium ANBcel5]
MTINDAIKTIVSGKNLSLKEARDTFTTIMNGEATSAQIAAFIMGLRMKGESVEEITAAAETMRDKATKVIPQSCEHLVDTCGTGGDSSNTFNISTATALVAAGAGARVAKHGNRSVSSKSGSADVLEALGVDITITPQQMKECIERVGIGFLFAPTLHKAMKFAAAPRKEIGIRTVFNVLGPLTNPAFTKQQLLGVFSAHLTETMATVLNNTGATRAFVVHGLDSLDEVSISAGTRVSEVKDGKVKTYTVEPEDFGLKKSPAKQIEGAEAKQNAAIITTILNGEKGAPRDIVVLNAGFALCAAGMCEEPREGVELAQRSIDCGSALNKLDELVSLTNSFKTVAQP